VAFGSLWVGTQTGDLFRLNPTNGAVVKRLGGLANTFAVVASDDAVWTGGDLALNRVDPHTYASTRVDAAHTTGYLATGGGFVWAADEHKGVVYKVDDSGKLVDTYATGEG